ncbi:unnamed protein product [Cyclocybe aegerita]|uniref:NmrA-like domain-containing protein n=1 Tax=Cyclocybe aegerita TaxID=1973307 RepID=A0A8S0WQT5_CYCAE|nr:unnamed protein product [Cyclocybe aegerita]
MTILVTGGTGKTGLAGVAPEPFKAVKFDWHEPSTFENPFHADTKIDRVYLVAPNEVDCLALMKPFIDLAITKGVKRFVLITVTQAEKGGPFYGKVHEYLANLGVDYVVLRPTWFMENFVTYARGIRDNDSIVSVTKTARLPFVAIEDIAQAAFDALVAEKSANTDVYVIGPELWSYDGVAAALTEILGRKITHKQITHQQQTDLFKYLGMSDEFATLLSDSEIRLEEGSEEAIVGSPKAIVGKRRLRDYLEANKNVWIKGSSLL